MGQSTNSTGVRLGWQTKWRSQIFSRLDQATPFFLYNDILIFLTNLFKQKTFRFSGTDVIFSHVNIQTINNVPSLDVYVYWAFEPLLKTSVTDQDESMRWKNWSPNYLAEHLQAEDYALLLSDKRYSKSEILLQERLRRERNISALMLAERITFYTKKNIRNAAQRSVLFTRVVQILKYVVLKPAITAYITKRLLTLGLKTKVNVCFIPHLRPNSRVISNRILLLLGGSEQNQPSKILSTLYNPLRFFRLTGFVIKCAGRFSRRQMATKDVFRYGSVPFSTLSKPIDYVFSTIKLRNGTCSIKIWSCQQK